MDFVPTHTHKNTNRQYMLIDSEVYVSVPKWTYTTSCLLVDQAGRYWALTQEEFQQKFQPIRNP